MSLTERIREIAAAFSQNHAREPVSILSDGLVVAIDTPSNRPLLERGISAALTHIWNRIKDSRV